MLVPVDDRGELEQRLVAIEKPEKEYPMHITVWQASRNRESKKQHVDRFRQWSSTIARDRKVVPERVEYETFCGTECRMTTPIILTAVHNRLRKVFEEVVNGLKVKISLVPRASVFLALELFYHAQDEEPVTSTLMFLLRTASGRSGHLVATQTFIKHVITERPDPTTYVGSILSPCELLHVEQPLCPEQFACAPVGCYDIYTEDEVFDVVCAFFQGLIPKASTRIATITILELKHTRCFTERSGDVRRVTEHHHRCVLDVLHPNENRKPEKALLVDRCLPGLRLGPRDTNEVDPETTLTSDSTLGEMIATLLDDSEELKFYHEMLEPTVPPAVVRPEEGEGPKDESSSESEVEDDIIDEAPRSPLPPPPPVPQTTQELCEELGVYEIGRWVYRLATRVKLGSITVGPVFARSPFFKVQCAREGHDCKYAVGLSTASHSGALRFLSVPPCNVIEHKCLIDRAKTNSL